MTTKQPFLDARFRPIYPPDFVPNPEPQEPSVARARRALPDEPAVWHLRFGHRPDTVTTMLDRSCVVLNCGTGESIELNHTGAMLWKAMTGSSPLAEIATAFGAALGVSEQKARADSLRLVTALHAEGLVTIS